MFSDRISIDPGFVNTSWNLMHKFLDGHLVRWLFLSSTVSISMGMPTPAPSYETTRPLHSVRLVIFIDLYWCYQWIDVDIGGEFWQVQRTRLRFGSIERDLKQYNFEGYQCSLLRPLCSSVCSAWQYVSVIVEFVLRMFFVLDSDFFLSNRHEPQMVLLKKWFPDQPS